MFHGENYWWGMPMMWIIWLPILIITVVMIIKYLDRNQSNETNSTPMDILKKRYAKGEITKEEYEEAKKTLE